MFGEANRADRTKRNAGKRYERGQRQPSNSPVVTAERSGARAGTLRMRQAIQSNSTASPAAAAQLMSTPAPKAHVRVPMPGNSPAHVSPMILALVFTNSGTLLWR